VSDGAVLPLGYGVNVNIPPLSANFTDPPVVQTRMTGDADTNYAKWDPETGTFTWENILPLAAGVNACLNGDCSLPGETFVVSQNKVSVSYYIVDYDAPTTWNTKDLEKRLKPLTEK
jgi:5'-nucleotidase